MILFIWEGFRNRKTKLSKCCIWFQCFSLQHFVLEKKKTKRSLANIWNWMGVFFWNRTKKSKMEVNRSLLTEFDYSMIWLTDILIEKKDLYIEQHEKAIRIVQSQDIWVGQSLK
jgi:hypothetical protein